MRRRLTDGAETAPSREEPIFDADLTRERIPAAGAGHAGILNGTGFKRGANLPELIRSMADLAGGLSRISGVASSAAVSHGLGSPPDPLDDSLRVFVERLLAFLTIRRRGPVPPKTRIEMLARKINLLHDTTTVETGEEMTFTAICEAAERGGYPISRTRWSLLKSGKEQKVPEEVLRVLAGVFGVDARYLLRADSPLPERIQQRMSELRSLRRERVRSVAVRDLANVDPEALHLITAILDAGQKVDRPLTGHHMGGHYG